MQKKRAENWRFSKMKKILLLILMCLFLVSGALAATIAISPNPAHDKDDLTCSVDGKTTGFLYYWVIDGNQAGSKNPLPASRTSAGDNVVCKVYAPTPFGEQYMGEASLKILADNNVPANNAPAVSITLPKDNSAYGIGDSVSFSAAGSDKDGDSLTYSWSFGDFHTASCKDAKHVYTKEGNFKATVTVKDSHGATGTDSVNLRVSKSAVNHAPKATINYPQDNDKFTTEAGIIFVAQATDEDGDSLVYMWDFGDGSTSKDARPTHTYLKSGNYNVKLIVSDGKLTDSDSVKLNIINKIYDVKSLTTYSDEYVTPADIFYRGNALYAKFYVKDRLTGKDVNGLDIDAYIYNANSGSGRVLLKEFNGFADGSLIVDGEPVLSRKHGYYFNLNNIPLDDSLLGRDIVFVIAYKLPNGGGQDQKFVQVLNNPVQLKSFPLVNVPLNGYATLALDGYVYDKETADSQIKWTFTGNNNIKVSINPATRVATFSSSVSGASEQITFTADDGDGSFASKTLTARVTGSADLLDADIAGGDRVVYAGDLVNFDGSGSKGNPTLYKWDFGDGSVSEGRTLTKASHAFDSAGVYTVTLTIFSSSSQSRTTSNSESVKVIVLDRVPDTNDNPVDDYSTEDREKKFAYMHGSVHSFDFGKLAPLYYQPSYNAGTNVRMLVELRNSGFADEDLELELYLIGENRQLFSNIHLDAGQNKIISASVFLPKDLEPGVHVIKAAASNNEDNVQKIAYWPIVVIQ
jgi:PKD repeat protein